MLNAIEIAIFLKFGLIAFIVCLKLSLIPQVLESLGAVNSLLRNTFIPKDAINKVYRM